MAGAKVPLPCLFSVEGVTRCTHIDRNGSVLAETQSSSERAAGPRGAQGRALRRGNGSAPERETPRNRDLSSMGEHRVPRKYIGVEENDFK